MLDARLAVRHFLQDGGAAVPLRLGASRAQISDLKTDLSELIQTVLKRDYLAGGTPEEHASIIRVRGALAVSDLPDQPILLACGLPLRQREVAGGFQLDIFEVHLSQCQ